MVFVSCLAIIYFVGCVIYLYLCIQQPRHIHIYTVNFKIKTISILSPLVTSSSPIPVAISLACSYVLFSKNYQIMGKYSHIIIAPYPAGQEPTQPPCDCHSFYCSRPDMTKYMTHLCCWRNIWWLRHKLFRVPFILINRYLCQDQVVTFWFSTRLNGYNENLKSKHQKEEEKKKQAILD